MTTPILEVENLTVAYATPSGEQVNLVEDISFTVAPKQVLCIVGESGSGKSVTLLAVMGLLPPSLQIVQGNVRFRGKDLLTMDERERRRLRGSDMAMVFQDPMTALNPVKRVGSQIGRTLAIHQPELNRDQRRAKVEELLASVGVPQPSSRARAYPHEWSGGMRQRAVIAMAMANSPSLMVADEPTTALDTTVQAQVMDSLADARKTSEAAMVLITHDLALVAQVADEVAIMYSGRFVETGSVYEVFDAPAHPYTRGLLASILREHGEPAEDQHVAGIEPDSTLKKRAFAIPGSPPAPAKRPAGCAFSPRCTNEAKNELCGERPLLEITSTGQRAACHHLNSDLLTVDPIHAEREERV